MLSTVDGVNNRRDWAADYQVDCHDVYRSNNLLLKIKTERGIDIPLHVALAPGTPSVWLTSLMDAIESGIVKVPRKQLA
jgi:hypothetical protein